MAEFGQGPFFLCFMDQDKFKVDMNAKKKEVNKFIFNNIILTR